VDGTTSQSIGINSSVTFTRRHGHESHGSARRPAHELHRERGHVAHGDGTSSGTATVSYSVTCATPNQPPTVNAAVGPDVLLGILYSETASFSDPNNDGPWSYTVSTFESEPEAPWLSVTVTRIVKLPSRYECTR